MNIFNKCLTTIENLIKRVSRVDIKPMNIEKQRILCNRIVIWSELYGNIQLISCRPTRNGGVFCDYTQTKLSTDVFLGLPYNIASYALLTHLIADLTGLKVGKLVYFGNDVHLYKNHLEQARTQLKRDPQTYALPQLKINRSVETIDDYTLDDFELIGYESYPSIKAQVSV